MHHENRVEEESAAIIARRTRIGLGLLAPYVALYAVFIATCAFAAPQLAQMHWLGLPVSILMGFALMLGAILVAALYGLLCYLR